MCRRRKATWILHSCYITCWVFDCKVSAMTWFRPQMMRVLIVGGSLPCIPTLRLVVFVNLSLAPSITGLIQIVINALGLMWHRFCCILNGGVARTSFVRIGCLVPWRLLFTVVLIWSVSTGTVFVWKLIDLGGAAGKSLRGVLIGRVLILSEAFASILIIDVLACMARYVIIIAHLLIIVNLRDVHHVLFIQILGSLVWALRSWLMINIFSFRSQHRTIEVLSWYLGVITSSSCSDSLHEVVRCLSLCKHRIIILSSYNWLIQVLIV